MATLLGQRGADRLGAAIQHPSLVRAATAQQQLVQRVKVGAAWAREKQNPDKAA